MRAVLVVALVVALAFTAVDGLVRLIGHDWAWAAVLLAFAVADIVALTYLKTCPGSHLDETEGRRIPPSSGPSRAPLVGGPAGISDKPGLAATTGKSDGNEPRPEGA